MPSLKHPLQWAALSAASMLLAWLLARAGMPASLLLGPMLAAVVFGLSGSPVRAPGWSFALAQGVIGCMVGGAVTPSILASLGRDWPVMLAVVSATLASGAAVGWGLMRWGSLPGATAAWGCSPGGAAAMTAMAGDFGADTRLVGFMQYLRLSVVVLTASSVARLLVGHAPGAGTAASFTPGLDAPLVPLCQTLAIVVGGALAGRFLRIPAGALLVPLAASAVLHSLHLVTITLPPWLLGLAYAFLGWHIGLRFNRETVRHAVRAIPSLLLATLALMGLCGLSAWGLTAFTGADALTAYLATSPGGLDSIAVIASAGGADLPFVLALQTLRLFAVVAAGPSIARLLCRLR